MTKKTIIKPGTRWGTFVYIRDVENYEPNKRPILVKCDCGVVKKVDYAALMNGTTGSCGSIRCLNKRKFMLEQEVMQLKRTLKGGIQLDDELLKDLTVYWNEIERTGNVHNVANGMLITKAYLGVL